MVAAQQQQRHVLAVQFGNQVVVQRAGVAGGRAGVEDVTGDQHGIHRVLLYLFEQPVNQQRVLALAAVVHEVLAQVPVRGVKNAHAVARRKDKADSMWMLSMPQWLCGGA